MALVENLLLFIILHFSDNLMQFFQIVLLSISIFTLTSSFRVIKQPQRRLTKLSKEKNDLNESHDFTSTLRSKYISAFIVLPIASYTTIPYLLSQVTDFSIEPSNRQLLLLALLLSKRLVLYITAILTVEIIALRSTELTGGLGQRLMAVNSELFSSLQSGDVYQRQQQMYSDIQKLQQEILQLEKNNDKKKLNKDDNQTREQSSTILLQLQKDLYEIEEQNNTRTEFDKIYDELDKVDSKQLSLALPLLLSASLAASFLLFNSVPTIQSPGSAIQVLQIASALSSSIVCFLFTKVNDY